jgi:mannose-6-phosphate isomerase-like protein (cupin superfamily)
MYPKSRYADNEVYITKDGSGIRELMHPGQHGNTNQSLAEATVPPGVTTLLHKHAISEEIYFITGGAGKMMLDDSEFEVGKGDTICIPPGASHQIQNTGSSMLVFLCCCSPAYSHEDTELLEDEH